ncbi:MAG: hypothetical protein ACXAC7_21530 [Candidatus Hodarchaeales archaeon]|jgi:HD superfamily phosphohydrolase YqeK
MVIYCSQCKEENPDSRVVCQSCFKPLPRRDLNNKVTEDVTINHKEKVLKYINELSKRKKIEIDELKTLIIESENNINLWWIVYGYFYTHQSKHSDELASKTLQTIANLTIPLDYKLEAIIFISDKLERSRQYKKKYNFTPYKLAILKENNSENSIEFFVQVVESLKELGDRKINILIDEKVSELKKQDELLKKEYERGEKYVYNYNFAGFRAFTMFNRKKLDKKQSAHEVGCVAMKESATFDMLALIPLLIWVFLTLWNPGLTVIGAIPALLLGIYLVYKLKNEGNKEDKEKYQVYWQ